MVFPTFLNFHTGGPLELPVSVTGILGALLVGFFGYLLVLATFLFQGHGQSVVVGALLVPLAGILVVCVQVYHIGNEGSGVEG